VQHFQKIYLLALFHNFVLCSGDEKSNVYFFSYECQGFSVLLYSYLPVDPHNQVSQKIMCLNQFQSHLIFLGPPYGLLYDKCLPIQNLLYVSFKHVLISLTGFMGTLNSMRILHSTSLQCESQFCFKSMNSWCTVSLHSNFSSFIYWMQQIWSVVDLLHCNPQFPNNFIYMWPKPWGMDIV
jgi:hypothetical protein